MVIPSWALLHLQRRLPDWRSTGLAQSCTLTLRDSSSGGALRGSTYMRRPPPPTPPPPPPVEPCPESATLPRDLPLPPLAAASAFRRKRKRKTADRKRLILRGSRYPREA